MKDMRINHLILGCSSIPHMESFYTELLGFSRVSTFLDTGTQSEGVILRHLDKQGNELDLLLVAMSPERRPSPQHLAVEVGPVEFESIYGNAKSKRMTIRAAPSLHSTELGIGTVFNGKTHYRNFYVLDPSGINVEILTVDLRS